MRKWLNLANLNVQNFLSSTPEIELFRGKKNLPIFRKVNYTNVVGRHDSLLGELFEISKSDRITSRNGVTLGENG